jgi:hypothetical protein
LAENLLTPFTGETHVAKKTEKPLKLSNKTKEIHLDESKHGEPDLLPYRLENSDRVELLTALQVRARNASRKDNRRWVLSKKDASIAVTPIAIPTGVNLFHIPFQSGCRRRQPSSYTACGREDYTTPASFPFDEFSFQSPLSIGNHNISPSNRANAVLTVIVFVAKHPTSVSI